MEVRDMSNDEWIAWVHRIFGSMEAYENALPRRGWVEGLNGWYSVGYD